jgi:hypothetical protein
MVDSAVLGPIELSFHFDTVLISQPGTRTPTDSVLLNTDQVEKVAELLSMWLLEVAARDSSQ